MGFREIKQQVVRCMQAGAYLHETRRDINAKNYLANGRVNREWVTELLNHTRGDGWRCSPHHQHSDIDVHVFKTWRNGTHWYVKFYFVEPHTVFISVHPDSAGENSNESL